MTYLLKHEQEEYKEPYYDFQTPLTSPRKNQDLRMQTAYKLFEAVPEGRLLVYKGTRAGCTTAMCAESINRHESYLILVPTISIAEDTVIKDSVKYSDRTDVNLIRLPSNHQCVHNQILCERFPVLEQLPILPLAESCRECEHFTTCPVTEVLHRQKRDGYAMTYQKAAALVLAANSAPNTTAAEILDKLATSHNLILDEVHELQYGRSVSLPVYNTYLKAPRYDEDKFLPICEDFPHLAKVVANFSMFMKETTTEEAIMRMKLAVDEDEFWKHKLSEKLKNNYTDVGKGSDNTKTVMAVYEEIIKLATEMEKYGLRVKDIKELYVILNLVISPHVIVHGIKDRGYVKVMMVAIDEAYLKMIREFVMSMQNKAKRIMLTSATLCSHDYSQYFIGKQPPKSVLFGSGGDPLKTNDQMLILADSKKYGGRGKYSRYKMQTEILSRVMSIIKRYGQEECRVVCMNIVEALDMKKALEIEGINTKVDYYKSSDSIGVAANERVLIAIGAAEKPSNAFDAITNSLEESRTLREEALHADTYQSWGRVKDPSGKERSLVFALGCSYSQCENIITWGVGRYVKLEKYTRGESKKVKVFVTGEKIRPPKLIKCKDFETMLEEAEKFKEPKNKTENPKAEEPLKYLIRNFRKNTIKIFSDSDFLSLFITRTDAYAQQLDTGNYVKVDGTITEELLAEHVSGEKTIGCYALRADSSVHWLCYDIDAHPREGEEEGETLARQRKAEEVKNLLCSFFEGVGIKPLLEASGTPYSYHIWIFVKPMPAAIAMHFANYVKDYLGIKDIEVNPKQGRLNRNGYGNLVKLPLATHRKTGNKSKIWYNGAWHESVEKIAGGLEVGAVEIIGWELPEVLKRDCEPVRSRRQKGVRPIFKWALTQRLENKEGHWMRIAIVREYYNNGMDNPEDLARLFSNQRDFDMQKSLDKVYSIIKEPMGCWTYETLSRECGSIVAAYEAGVDYIARPEAAGI